MTKSWDNLLKQLATEKELLKQKGSAKIPQINFEDLGKAPEEFMKEMKRRGVGVVKGVVPQSEARGYKNETEEYVRMSPSTKDTSSRLVLF